MIQNSQKDLVSVIVPVYNVERYLRECLDSIVKQTYKNIEVIMVDDGSKDSSGIICDEYSAKYENLQTIHKKNAGLGLARNTGLDVALGEYVYFLDSDDYISCDEIEKLVEAIKQNKVDACFAGFCAVNDEGAILRERRYKNKVYFGKEAKEQLLPLMIGSSPAVFDSIEMSAAGQLYSIKPIKEHHIRFCSERELISEDMVFNIDYMQYANGACTVNRIGNHYRMNVNSLSHSYSEDRFERSKYFFVEMKKKLISLGYDLDVLERLTKTFFIYMRTSIDQELHANNRSRKEKIKMLKKICSDEVTIQAIKNYPVRKLGLRQQIFLFLVRHKLVHILSTLVAVQNVA